VNCLKPISSRVLRVFVKRIFGVFASSPQIVVVYSERTEIGRICCINPVFACKVAIHSYIFIVLMLKITTRIRLKISNFFNLLLSSRFLPKAFIRKKSLFVKVVISGSLTLKVHQVLFALVVLLSLIPFSFDKPLRVT
jgi:hypothetical protein